jgi:hypothetical protein
VRGPGRSAFPGARPWLATGVAGVAGTAALSLGLAAESRLRRTPSGPVDYDASDHVVIAACTVLRRPVPDSPARRRLIFDVVHWGYGSAVALEYEVLRRLLGSDRAASAAFYAGCQGMALALFPTVGGTPPPWRWSREVLASSFGMHAVYVAVVAAVARRLR